jgi:hypothetical protein
MTARIPCIQTVLIALAVLAVSHSSTSAQVPFPSDVTSPDARRGYRPATSPGSVDAAPRRATSPFLDSTSNPYLNPYLTNRITPDAALLYMLAAQRESGGIGSGALSGVRQARLGASDSARAATMPPSAAAPEFGAARYFHRGIHASGQPTAGYFNRSMRRMGR